VSDESWEQCGCVRDLGLGPCPSKLFGYNVHSYSGPYLSFPSYTQSQNHVHNLLVFHLALKNQYLELPLDKYWILHGPTWKLPY